MLKFKGMKTQVINVLGGPGSGKSTISAGVYNLLKKRGVEVELISEYPKTLVYEERKATFDDSLYLFAKQAHIQFTVNGKVDYMVTDRPLIMSNVYHLFWMYQDWPNEWNEAFYNMVKQTWDLYDNKVYFINRVIPFHPANRNETEEQARQQDKMFKKCLDDLNIEYTVIDGDDNASQVIYDDLIKKELAGNISIL